MYWLLVLLLLFGAIGLVLLSGLKRWESATAQLLSKLHSDARAVPAAPPGAQESAPPPVVMRFFSFAIPERTAALPTSVVLRQSGAMRLGSDPDKWSPLRAAQHISACPPGFVWDARISMGPGMTVCVRDSYVAGQGAMQAALFGTLRIVDQQGTAELGTASLQRWLAEAAWLPTALLLLTNAGEGAARLSWRELDAHSAIALMDDGQRQVELEFRFSADGAITSIYSPARFRDVKGRAVPTPWEGRFGDYEMHGGLVIPLSAEVGWHIDGQYQPYWRGRIESAEFS